MTTLKDQVSQFLNIYSNDENGSPQAWYYHWVVWQWSGRFFKLGVVGS